MNNIQDEYRGIVSAIYNGGRNKKDRTGTGTRSLFGKLIEHDMHFGFPILNGKRINFNAAKTELLWILNGRTDLKYLEDNGVKYWRPDYERSKRTDETLGPVYGKQWRDFEGIDQFYQLVHELNYTPYSRRLMVNAWNPIDIPQMALPPCHYGFQVNVNDGKLDLMWQQRSADVFLGLPYDIAMYGLLLELLAKGAGLKPGKLIGSLGDCHLYNNHIEQAETFLSRYSNPECAKLELDYGIFIDSKNLLHLPELNEIRLNNYNPQPLIKAPLSVGK
jgi:thymidylate synthase